MKNFRYNIDSVDFIGVYARLRGWVYFAEKKIATIAIRFEGIEHNDSVDALGGLLRVDVASTLKTLDAAHSGFWCDGLICMTSGVIFMDVTLETEQVAVVVPLGEVLPNSSGAGWRFVAGPGRLDELRAAPLRTALTSLGEMPPSLHGARTLGAMEWNATAPRYRARRPVTLLTSVYKGEEYLDDFFRTVALDADGYDEFIVVDNGNTDAGLRARLVALTAQIPKAKLVQVEENAGYIAGICAAYAARTLDGHIVVLNTDIVLPQNWVGRLIQPLEETPNIACVTPFTNSGETTSFPLMPLDNKIYRGLSVDVIDRAFQQVRPEMMLQDLPSGVGFCMAVNADSLTEIGYFDLDSYGFGYGEENDWCLRAWIKGQRSVLLPNMFVYHKHGGVYPSEQKRALIDRNLKIIRERFPFYDGWVGEHIRADPLAGIRQVIAFTLAGGTTDGTTPFVQTRVDTAGIFKTIKNQPCWIMIVDAASDASWMAILSANGGRWCLWGWGAGEKHALLERFGQMTSAIPG
jgi:GT2 family glycosyltransferase